MMKRLINRIATLSALLSVAAAVSCSKGDREPIPSSHDGVIRIGSSSIGIAGEGGQGQTKALASSTTALSEIWFFCKNDAATTLLADMSGGTTAKGSRASGSTTAITWTSSPAPQYDKMNAYAHLVGCYPGGGSGVTATASSVVWTIDGKTDIMTSDRFSAGNYATPGTSSMMFQHRLAALEVIVKAQARISTDIVNALWGKITGIELVNTAQTATYAAASAGTDNGMSYSGSVNLPLWKGTTYEDAFEPMTIPSFGAAGAGAVCASGMFAPSTGTFTLRVSSTGGAPVDVVVQLKSGLTNVNFLVSQKHTVTLLLTVPERTIYVEGTSVTPWDEGGDGNSTAIPPQQDKTPAKGFLDWNYTGLVKSGLGYSLPVFTQSGYNSYTTDNNGKKYLYTQAYIDAERPYVSLKIAEAEESATTTGWQTTTVQTQGKGDATGAAGAYVDVDVTRATWEAAYAACKAKTTDGGGWRLPRASELMLMKMNQTELEKTTNFATFSNLSKWTWRPPYTNSDGQQRPGYWNEVYYNAKNGYWAATESGVGATAWMVCFGGGNTIRPAQKTEFYNVRCVKESI